MNKFFSAGGIVTLISVVFFFADLYLLCVFPSNLILELFWEKAGKEEIESLEYNYGQLAGIPAGEGVTVLEDIGQYAELGSREYITFKTESIIPLNAYKLKSGTDRTNNTYRRAGNQVRSGRQWNTYSTVRPLTKAYIYNRYYLVQLPDGSYVTAYLEDAYYWKYKLTGTVQLPLGRVTDMLSQEKDFLSPYIEKYELDEERVLVMFSEERYEQHKTLYKVIQLTVFVMILAIYIAVVFLVRNVLHRMGR